MGRQDTPIQSESVGSADMVRPMSIEEPAGQTLAPDAGSSAVVVQPAGPEPAPGTGTSIEASQPAQSARSLDAGSSATISQPTETPTALGAGSSATIVPNPIASVDAARNETMLPA